MPIRLVSVSALALMIAACGADEEEAAVEAAAPMAEEAEAPMSDEGMADEGMMDKADAMGPSITDVMADTENRGEAAMARDKFRHPAETMEFFGLEPTMTVIEVTPGGGWYTDILAPYIGLGGGSYVAAKYDPSASERAMARAEAYKAKYMTGEFGNNTLIPFVGGEGIKAEPGSADMVLTFRNAHNWKMSGYADDVFASFYDALKPGGVLGVVDHRLPEEADTGMEDSSGYLKESTVIALAEGAGFVLDAKSEVNANPQDTADHPFGVWTLPPVSRTSGRDGSVPEGFDAAAYLEIGESDRMTLRFVKPAE